MDNDLTPPPADLSIFNQDRIRAMRLVLYDLLGAVSTDSTVTENPFICHLGCRLLQFTADIGIARLCTDLARASGGPEFARSIQLSVRVFQS